MTAAELVPVAAAYMLDADPPRADAGNGASFMLSLLLLADGRCVEIHVGRDRVHASMDALAEYTRERGWRLGVLVHDAETLAYYADGYEIGGSDGTR